MAGSILALVFFVLKLFVALAKVPGKIALGIRGWVEDFALCGRWPLLEW
jgi:hypothetical protein